MAFLQHCRSLFRPLFISFFLSSILFFRFIELKLTVDVKLLSIES
jgi:hypothetical protein